MRLIDIVRFVIFAEAGVALSFMVGTNILAWKVLRPARKRVGFLWWHITTVSIGVICIGVIALERVLGKLGSPQTWRTWTTLVGMTSLAAAQTIIFHVERQRFVEKRVIQRRGAHALERALSDLEDI